MSLSNSINRRPDRRDRDRRDRSRSRSRDGNRNNFYSSNRNNNFHSNRQSDESGLLSSHFLQQNSANISTSSNPPRHSGKSKEEIAIHKNALSLALNNCPILEAQDSINVKLEWYVQFLKVIDANKLETYFDHDTESHADRLATIEQRSSPDYFAIAATLINNQNIHSLKEEKEMIDNLFNNTCIAYHISTAAEFTGAYPHHNQMPNRRYPTNAQFQTILDNLPGFNQYLPQARIQFHADNDVPVMIHNGGPALENYEIQIRAKRYFDFYRDMTNTSKIKLNNEFAAQIIDPNLNPAPFNLVAIRDEYTYLASVHRFIESKLKTSYATEEKNYNDLIAKLNSDVTDATHLFSERIGPDMRKTVQHLIDSKDYPLALRNILRQILIKASAGQTTLEDILKKLKWTGIHTYESIKALFLDELYKLNLAKHATLHNRQHGTLDNFVINRPLLTANGSLFTDAQILAMPGMVILTPYDDVNRWFQALLLSRNDKLITDILIDAAKASVQVEQTLTFIDAKITRLSNSNIIQIALGMKQTADNEAAIHHANAASYTAYNNRSNSNSSRYDNANATSHIDYYDRSNPYLERLDHAQIAAIKTEQNPKKKRKTIDEGCAICKQTNHETDECNRLWKNAGSDFLTSVISNREKSPSRSNPKSASKFVTAKIEKAIPTQFPITANAAVEAKRSDSSSESSDDEGSYH
jgi:hypothetical protein